MVKSTLDTETLALLEGGKSSFMMKSLISDAYLLPSAESIQITCATDNQSFILFIFVTKTITDRRLKVDMSVVRICCNDQKSNLFNGQKLESNCQTVLPRKESIFCGLPQSLTRTRSTFLTPVLNVIDSRVYSFPF